MNDFDFFDEDFMIEEEDNTEEVIDREYSQMLIQKFKEGDGSHLTPKEKETLEKIFDQSIKIIDSAQYRTLNSDDPNTSYNIFKKRVNYFFPSYDSDIKNKKERPIYNGGYLGMVRTGIPALLALGCNFNSLRLFVYFIYGLDTNEKNNKVRFTRGEMKEMLGVQYKTLDRILLFLTRNGFIRINNDVKERRESGNKYNQRVLEIELNYYLIFDGRFTKLYGSSKETEEQSLIKMEKRFYKPMSDTYWDGDHIITIDDKLNIKRVKMEK